MNAKLTISGPGMDVELDEVSLWGHCYWKKCCGFTFECFVVDPPRSFLWQHLLRGFREDVYKQLRQFKGPLQYDCSLEGRDFSKFKLALTSTCLNYWWFKFNGRPLVQRWSMQAQEWLALGHAADLRLAVGGCSSMLVAWSPRLEVQWHASCTLGPCR